jgi:hypothetical protein
VDKKDFWAKSFFFAQKNYYDSLQSPVVYDRVGEPFVRDKYNFIEYCALFADTCLAEYRYFLERVNKEEGETEPLP